MHALASAELKTEVVLLGEIDAIFALVDRVLIETSVLIDFHENSRPLCSSEAEDHAKRPDIARP
jgi:hypothetical protein